MARMRVVTHSPIRSESLRMTDQTGCSGSTLLRRDQTPGHRRPETGLDTMTIGQRVRDVRQGPDGYLYVLTDEDDGAVLRILPEDD
jgi:glucose/arabinose dehydrogenase